VNLKNQPSYIAWRFYLILAVVFLAVAGLMTRVMYLSSWNQSFLRKQGDDRVLRMVSTPAFRGMIVDRNGYPLAVSTTVYSAWMNPKEFDPNKIQLKSFATLLEMETKDITTILNRDKAKKREFAYIKRSLSPELAAKIKALNLKGIYLQEDYRRYYPEGEITAHVIGFTNIDDHGQEGLELAYNQWLEGEQGKKWVIKDRLGRTISDVQTISDQQPGHDLVLSIDRRIQYLAYRELLTGVAENKAKSGSAVVLDAKTGEILAMVNVPSYNPNNRPTRMSDVYRNRAVTDTFEPGSTVKPFSVALALSSKKFTPNTVIDTTPGWMRVGKNIVKDHESKGALTVAQILQYSSNVGITKMMLGFNPNQLWNLLHNAGFGEETEVRFPGEQHGSLVKHDPWGQFVFATYAFGYGISVNTLQLARAYTIFANDGMRYPVSLLRLSQFPQGEQVIQPKIAREILAMLESVTEKGGTAEAARVPGFRIAGKTGTSKLAGNGGYLNHRYSSSFVGIAPLTNPRVIIVVMINDPQGKNYFGGWVSGPIFSRIMEGTLRILDVPPDEK